MIFVVPLTENHGKTKPEAMIADVTDKREAMEHYIANIVADGKEWTITENFYNAPYSGEPELLFPNRYEASTHCAGIMYHHEQFDVLTYDEYQEQMQAAFDLVKNDDDWRAMVRATIKIEDLQRVKRAVAYFTSTEVRIVACNNETHEVTIEADGYRAGPAGP